MDALQAQFIRGWDLPLKCTFRLECDGFEDMVATRVFFVDPWLVIGDE